MPLTKAAIVLPFPVVPAGKDALSSAGQKIIFIQNQHCQ
jgi:hypothetical protein